MGIDDGEGRCPKLVLERSITNSTGRATSQRRYDGAKILWKRDFVYASLVTVPEAVSLCTCTLAMTSDSEGYRATRFISAFSMDGATVFGQEMENLHSELCSWCSEAQEGVDHDGSLLLGQC